MDERPIHASCVDAHAERDPEGIGLIAEGRRWSWRDLQRASRRLAWHLRAAHGIERGDRVAVVLGQRAEAAIAHVACSRVDAIAMPLSPLFGPEGLRTRMADGAPALTLTDASKVPVVREAMPGTPMRIVDDAGFQALLQKGPAIDPAEEARNGGDAPMWLVYTSGTTGGPKGALLPHRVIAGRMPGFLLAHEPFDASTARFWSPADWSWIGGLLDSLFAPWHAGAAVVAHERKGHFDAREAFELMRAHRVTNAFLPPTALKALVKAEAPPGLALRAIHSAGEPLPAPVRAQVSAQVCPVVNEVYGLTEAAFLIGTATKSYATPEGSMGSVYPGHRVTVRDEELCVARDDPTLMLGYWRGVDVAPHLPLDEEGLLHTGDLAEPFPDGSFRFLGRKDDLIKTSGHRVGPAEVEAALLRHPAVAECAVVGVPDEARGQRIKAFVKRAAGATVSAAELQEFVKTRLAAHAYPREVEFVDALPMTVSGKIRRRELRAR